VYWPAAAAAAAAAAAMAMARAAAMRSVRTVGYVSRTVRETACVRRVGVVLTFARL